MKSRTSTKPRRTRTAVPGWSAAPRGRSTWWSGTTQTGRCSTSTGRSAATPACFPAACRSWRSAPRPARSLDTWGRLGPAWSHSETCLTSAHSLPTLLLRFDITDSEGNVALIIKGPWCTFSCGGDVDFRVLTPDGETEVGRISKQWTGLLKEAFTDADNFGISFPMDLDVRCKATLIGAVFLIDYMFFEKKANQDNDGFGMI